MKRIYVIKCGAAGSSHYLASIEDGNAAKWSVNEYGTKIRAPRKKLTKDEDKIIRTAIYKADIAEAMEFEGAAAARAFIAKEPVLRYCTVALKSREQVKA